MREHFLNLKSKLELTQTFDETIQQKHAAVRSVLENKIPGIQTKLVGSLQRKTRIMPREEDIFDIDILIVLGEFTNWADPPHSGILTSHALGHVEGAIQDSPRYSSMSPQSDHPVVRFEYQDGVKVELIPAYIDNIGHSASGLIHAPAGRAFWIPKAHGWELADYDYDAEQLTAQNTVSKEMLVPVIKMLKSLKRLYFPTLGSYHLEVICYHVIPSLIQRGTIFKPNYFYDDIITDFFLEASKYLGTSSKIASSHTPAISLAGLDLISVQAIFLKLHVYCQAIASATDDQVKLEMWKKLFANLIP